MKPDPLKLDPLSRARLQFLCRVVEKEARYLGETDARLFSRLIAASVLDALETDPPFAEQLDAFVSRYGRLQDSLADKLLPVLLEAMAEQRGAAIDNLDRAEKLGLIESVDDWLTARKLRNLMVHEYIEDQLILFDALVAAHRFVPMLLDCADRLIHRARSRFDV